MSLRLLALLAVAGDALVATTRRAAPAVARRSATHTIEAREVEGPLEPLSNYLLVKVDPIKDTSGGGIILGSASEPASTGEVVSAGPGREDPESGVLLPVQCAVGDRVMWGRYSGANVRYDNADHTLLKDRDVSMVWTGDLAADSARPIGSNVLVKVSENAGATASGLLLGLGAQDKISLTGEVIQVGPGKLLRDGGRGPVPVAAGDSVRFRDYDVVEVVIDGEEYVLVGTEHVICKWTA